MPKWHDSEQPYWHHLILKALDTFRVRRNFGDIEIDPAFLDSLVSVSVTDPADIATELVYALDTKNPVQPAKKSRSGSDYQSHKDDPKYILVSKTFAADLALSILKIEDVGNRIADDFVQWLVSEKRSKGSIRHKLRCILLSTIRPN